MRKTVLTKMMRNLTTAIFCAMAFAVSMPAVPAYARPRTTVSATSEMKMRDAAGAVQEAFDSQDMKKLSSLCSYPLSFTDSSGNAKKIKTSKEFMALGSQTIFTQSLLDDIAAANTAKISASSKGELQIGNNNGVVMKKVKGKWKITRIYMEKVSAPTPSISGITGDMASAAEQFQKTFYYRDLETLSASCSYPVKIYFSAGRIQDVQTQKEMMDLGEKKVFTDEMVEAIMQADLSKLQENSGSVQVGGISGFYMNKSSGTWKIDTIVQ